MTKPFGSDGTRSFFLEARLPTCTFSSSTTTTTTTTTPHTHTHTHAAQLACWDTQRQPTMSMLRSAVARPLRTAALVPGTCLPPMNLLCRSFASTSLGQLQSTTPSSKTESSGSTASTYSAILDSLADSYEKTTRGAVRVSRGPRMGVEATWRIWKPSGPTARYTASSPGLQRHSVAGAFGSRHRRIRHERMHSWLRCSRRTTCAAS